MRLQTYYHFYVLLEIEFTIIIRSNAVTHFLNVKRVKIATSRHIIRWWVTKLILICFMIVINRQVSFDILLILYPTIPGHQIPISKFLFKGVEILVDTLGNYALNTQLV
ncbi:hypothetical protein RF11_07037 [Thelohanellus kitauei]|uniref:Uncharacterized protein n=1 Tax=Thelohanellus kitauei TaxID=669202 RepID=A0A0C2MCF7_THEKT|nr:hypothetical protein RF11_07037 [Thelohanellus kitauei]